MASARVDKKAIRGALVLLLLCACEARKGAIPSRPRREPTALRFDATALGKDRRLTLATLTMDHGRFARGLGPHRVTARSKLTRTARGNKEIKQALSIVADGQGHYSVRKQTSEQYGVELIFTGKWLYSRLRYQPFSRRLPADDKEPGRLLNKHYGLLAAYLRLLGPFTAITRGSASRYEGREAIILSLARRNAPADPPAGVALERAKRWRRSIDVEALSGKVVVDARTGAALKAELEARFSFALPRGEAPKTGIPRELSSERGGVALSFEQTISEIGKRQQIVAPPEDERMDLRRRRLEIERQMVTGERPLDPSWRARWGDIERTK